MKITESSKADLSDLRHHVFATLNLVCSRGVSIQGGVSVQWVSVHWSLCPGGLCPGGVSVLGGLCPGGLSGRSPFTVMCRRYASYWSAFLFKNVIVQTVLTFWIPLHKRELTRSLCQIPFFIFIHFTAKTLSNNRSSPNLRIAPPHVWEILGPPLILHWRI